LVRLGGGNDRVVEKREEGGTIGRQALEVVCGF